MTRIELIQDLEGGKPVAVMGCDLNRQFCCCALCRFWDLKTRAHKRVSALFLTWSLMPSWAPAAASWTGVSHTSTSMSKQHILPPSYSRY